MKSFVIYLTIFFIIASIYRGRTFKVDTNSSKYFHNPFLNKQQNSNKHNKHIEPKIAKPKYVKESVHKLKEPQLILDISSILSTQLQPIEQKYLQKSIQKYLSSRWYSKNPYAKSFKLTVDIDKNLISSKRFIRNINKKRQYRIVEKSKIKIKYKIYNSSGKLLLNSYIPYNVIIKSASFWDFIESERLAKKELFTHIGKKIANSLNRRFYYIVSYDKR